MNRHQDDDLQALRRMLPVPAERDFPVGRHDQRGEHLMTSWLTMSRPARERRNLGMRVALPAGLAAAAAGIALTAALPAQTAAAYTLQTAHDGTVKLTIVNSSGKIDINRLQQDLDELGVNSRVYAGDPDCPTPVPRLTGSPGPNTVSIDPSPGRTSDPSPTDTASPEPGSVDEGWELASENGKSVLYVRPDKMPVATQLQIVFPLAETDPAHASGVFTAGLVDSPGPDCMPAGGAVFYER